MPIALVPSLATAYVLSATLRASAPGSALPTCPRPTLLPSASPHYMISWTPEEVDEELPYRPEFSAALARSRRRWPAGSR